MVIARRSKHLNNLNVFRYMKGTDLCVFEIPHFSMFSHSNVWILSRLRVYKLNMLHSCSRVCV